MPAALAVIADDATIRCRTLDHPLSPVADLVLAYAGTWFGHPVDLDDITRGLHGIPGVHLGRAEVRSAAAELARHGLATTVEIEAAA